MQHNLEAQTATVLKLNNSLKKLKDTQKEIQNSLQIKEKDYKVLQQNMGKARIKIKEKTKQLMGASNALKNETAILTQHLEAMQIEMKQIIKENDKLCHALQLTGPKKEKAV